MQRKQVRKQKLNSSSRGNKIWSNLRQHFWQVREVGKVGIRSSKQHFCHIHKLTILLYSWFVFRFSVWFGFFLQYVVLHWLWGRRKALMMLPIFSFSSPWPLRPQFPFKFELRRILQKLLVTSFWREYKSQTQKGSQRLLTGRMASSLYVSLPPCAIKQVWIHALNLKALTPLHSHSASFINCTSIPIIS